MPCLGAGTLDGMLYVMVGPHPGKSSAYVPTQEISFHGGSCVLVVSLPKVNDSAIFGLLRPGRTDRKAALEFIPLQVDYAGKAGRQIPEIWVGAEISL